MNISDWKRTNLRLLKITVKFQEQLSVLYKLYTFWFLIRIEIGREELSAIEVSKQEFKIYYITNKN